MKHSNGNVQAGLGLEFDVPVASDALDLVNVERGFASRIEDLMTPATVPAPRDPS
jgi:hypothetical protein